MIEKLFDDKDIIEKIKVKLPYLFEIANEESKRGDKISMEVGTLRERIVISLLFYKFGSENINADIPTTESEVDIYLKGNPISIKTATGGGAIKLIWTVDKNKALEFKNNYKPSCDIIFVKIVWDSIGAIYLFKKQLQIDILKEIGYDRYIKLPKEDTNPRGVEMSKEALNILMDRTSKKIEIAFLKTNKKVNVYERWIDYWEND